MLEDIYKTTYEPSSIAIKFKGEEITYSELDKTINKYSSAFRKIGIKDGEKVILSCPNSPEFIYSYLSVVKNAGIIVPVNIQLTIEEIKYISEDCEAKFMIMHSDIFKKTGKTKEILEEILNLKIIVLNECFKKGISEIISEDINKTFIDENSISTFLYTSGTTGKPKAVMLSHKNLLINAKQTRIALQGTQKDNYMCVLPMYHVFSFTTCVLNPLLTGSTITVLERFNPKEVIEAFLKEDITIFAGVPAMYVVLLEACKEISAFPKLRLAISGGAPLPVEILRQAKSILKLPVVEGYGLTEAAPVLSFNPLDGIQKEGSIGLPLLYIECKIVDENGIEVISNEVGEITVRGDNVMKGYFKKEEETKKAIKEGWLYTGDLAYKDEEGYIFIVDRKKDMVIVGGLNVYPREIEEVLYKHHNIKEAAVIGVGDKLRGEHVKAFVVLKEDDKCTSKDILKYLKQYIAPYKMPREIEFISELPKNSTGKILKRMLKS